jgi:hypothetical protein
MEPRRPRWRFRISTLMLLVVISALLFERWQREREMRRTEAALQAALRRAELNALLAEAAQHARAMAEAVNDRKAGGK